MVCDMSRGCSSILNSDTHLLSSVMAATVYCKRICLVGSGFNTALSVTGIMARYGMHNDADTECVMMQK